MPSVLQEEQDGPLFCPALFLPTPPPSIHPPQTQARVVWRMASSTIETSDDPSDRTRNASWPCPECLSTKQEAAGCCLRHQGRQTTSRPISDFEQCAIKSNHSCMCSRCTCLVGSKPLTDIFISSTPRQQTEWSAPQNVPKAAVCCLMTLNERAACTRATRSTIEVGDRVTSLCSFPAVLLPGKWPIYLVNKILIRHV